MNIFEQKSRFGEYGRTGVLHTRAGDVLTPTFMPDGTRGAVKGLTPQQVVDTGVGVVLANTYHLHLQPGEAVIKELGGLHAFANRKGPMLTDSGGFQVFSLGEHVKITEEGVHFKDPKTGDKRFISPEKSMQIQLDLGADMIVAFDHLIGLGDETETEVKDAFDRTHRWLERCIVEFKRLTKDMDEAERPLLFGVVQGGLNLKLRKKSLEIVQESEVDGIAIGGLSVGETRAEMETVLKALAPLYRDDRPRFLLGVGTPEDLKIAVENGIDMLDCVLPTRNARHATVWTSKTCDAPSCQTAELSALKELEANSVVETSGTQSSYQVYDSFRASVSPSSSSSRKSYRAKGKNNQTIENHSTPSNELICSQCGDLLSEKIHLTNER
ncbi:tRNA guanosine(34) transglycosylase Tgt, partial [Candidatus Saccharibacteria bacterium]|nr:tRNA guanosine(34) transglycosylase Tgt [Candidatus Saccharibacteria bacterium]